MLSWRGHGDFVLTRLRLRGLHQALREAQLLRVLHVSGLMLRDLRGGLGLSLYGNLRRGQRALLAHLRLNLH